MTKNLSFFVNTNTCSSSGKLGSRSLFQGPRLSKDHDGKWHVEKLKLYYFVFLIYRKKLKDYFLLLLKNSYIFLENWQLWSLNCAIDSTHSKKKQTKTKSCSKSKTAVGNWKQLIIEPQQNHHFCLKKQTHILLLEKKKRDNTLPEYYINWCPLQDHFWYGKTWQLGL